MSAKRIILRGTKEETIDRFMFLKERSIAQRNAASGQRTTVHRGGWRMMEAENRRLQPTRDAKKGRERRRPFQPALDQEEKQSPLPCQSELITNK